MRPTDKATADSGSVQSFAIIKNTGHRNFVIGRFHPRARRLYWKKLTDCRKKAKILADNRKRYYPIETLKMAILSAKRSISAILRKNRGLWTVYFASPISLCWPFSDIFVYGNVVNTQTWEVLSLTKSSRATDVTRWLVSAQDGGDAMVGLTARVNQVSQACIGKRLLSKTTRFHGSVYI